ncbi:MAG TPA: 4-hydroxy-3-methylbut-2-enyl diphosphate reductase, partial [Azospirillaceae bacterium]|nr:4-hydroxy-3-methylbut-2-enyl diphosphate reductase [Azospirillaceae bacterium]
ALEGIRTLGITAGASAPDVLIQEVLSACRDRFEVAMEEAVTATENVVFKLPRVLAAEAAPAAE